MPDAPEPTAAGVRVLDHAVLRVAAWPIEIVEQLTAPALADAARAVLADRGATGATSGPTGPDGRTDGDRLAEEIHAAVPTVEDRTTRRWLLAARRALRTGGDLVPAAPTGAAEAVAHLDGGPALVASIEAAGVPRADAAGRRAGLAASLAEELTRSRLALRTLGATDRFRAALAIAEPSVLVRWEATRDKPLNDKARVRRLEATVLHFAMRACGRPTPNGGWSGVAAVVPDSGAAPRGPTTGDPNAILTVRRAPRRAHVSVDLAPFAAVLAAWARELGGARDHPLRREPTLRDDPGTPVGTPGSPPGEDHRWVYLRRDTDPATFVALPTVAALRSALDRWPPGTVATPAALYDDIGEGRGRAVVEHLLACGVLHSALGLPAFADSPADALEAVTALLPEAQARTWATTIATIGDATRSLEAAFLADDVAGVVRHRDAIHAAVGALTTAAGVGDAPDRGLVHVDLGVPWRATWRAAGRAAVGRAIDDVFAFHAADGDAEAYRAVMAGRVRATGTGDVLAGIAGASGDWVGPPPAVARRADLLRAVGVDPGPAERRWTAALDPGASAGRGIVELDVDLPRRVHPGSAGSFIVAVGTATWARWGRPQPGMFVTRFAPLLRTSSHDGAERHEPGHGVGSAVASLAGALRRLGAARIVGADAANPNAALRPPLDDVPAWGWSLAGGVADPPPATIAERDGAAVFRTADHGDLVPVYDSAAVIGTRDPVSRFVRTAAMTHGWELAAWGFPVLEAELDRWTGLSRLVLPSPAGPPSPPTVLAPRRWVVGGAALDAIRAETDEVERYLAWRAEMDRRDIPAIVVARWALLPDAPELILATESPLALRCLCERLADGPATLVLSELPGPVDGWAVRSAEGHHLSELAVTWVRRTPPLDPAVFPGGVVPGSFAAILDALDDADPAPIGPDTVPPVTDVEHRQRARFAALLAELVEPGERRTVAHAAAAWLTRVADAQDPAGAGSGSAAAAITPEPPEDPADARLHADLASLRPIFDADIAAITANGGDDVGDDGTVRTQLIARLGHIDAVARWGEGPDRLRAEASVWLTTPTT